MLDERRGLLVTPGNVDELAAALCELVDDIHERAKIDNKQRIWLSDIPFAHLAESLREIFVQWWPASTMGGRS